MVRRCCTVVVCFWIDLVRHVWLNRGCLSCVFGHPLGAVITER